MLKASKCTILALLAIVFMLSSCDKWEEKVEEEVWPLKKQMVGTWTSVYNSPGRGETTDTKIITFEEDGTFHATLHRGHFDYYAYAENMEVEFIGTYAKFTDEYNRMVNVKLTGKEYDVQTNSFIRDFEMKCYIGYDSDNNQLVISDREPTRGADKIEFKDLFGKYTKVEDSEIENIENIYGPSDEGPDFLVHTLPINTTSYTYIYQSKFQSIYFHKNNDITFSGCNLVDYGPLTEANDEEIKFEPESSSFWWGTTKLAASELAPDRGYRIKANYVYEYGKNKGKKIELQYNLYFTDFQYINPTIGYTSNPQYVHFQRVK